MVAVDSDASVRQVKGEGRPVIGAEQSGCASWRPWPRWTMSPSSPALNCRNSWPACEPDILTKGSNYPEAQVAGREIVAGYGGQVVLVPVTDPVSVSDLIRRIRREV